MNTQIPTYETNYMGFSIKVYSNRVEFRSAIPGVQSIPINQIASVQLGMMGYMQITLETSGGKKYKIPCFKKKEVRDAIYNAQAAFNTSGSNNTSVADELTKLADLKKQGLISEQEFENQKKKLLS